jgi:hypothetical protein
MTKDTKNGSKLYFKILKTWKNWESTSITSIPFPFLRTSFPIPSGQIPVPATQIPFSQSKNRSIPVPILPLQDPLKMQGIFRVFLVVASVTFHCGIVGSGLRNLAKTCSRWFKIAHALELLCVFRYDITELYWFCMDFYCAVLWMFVIMKWRPSTRSEEHLHVSNYFLEYCDGILPSARPVWTPEQASCYLKFE